MSTRGRTTTSVAVSGTGAQAKPKPNLAVEPSSKSFKEQKIETAKRRSVLTSPTAASRAKALPPRSSVQAVPKKAVVAKVVTASTLRAAQAKKTSIVAKESATAKPTAVNKRVTAAKPTITKPAGTNKSGEDEEDDIYAYYAKKKQRMENLSNSSKAPALGLSGATLSLSASRPLSSVEKAALIASLVITEATTDARIPPDTLPLLAIISGTAQKDFPTLTLEQAKANIAHARQVFGMEGADD